MDANSILWLVPPAVVLISIALVLLGVLNGSSWLVISFSSIALFFSNSTPINALSEYSGLGGSWIVISIIVLLLISCYGERAILPRNEYGMLLLIMVVCICYLLFLVGMEGSSLKRVISITLVWVTGLVVVAGGVTSDRQLTMKKLMWLTYARHASGIGFSLLVLVFVGTSAIEPTSYSQIQLGDLSLSRLQAVGIAPATGLGATSAVGVLFIAHLMARAKGLAWWLLLFALALVLVGVTLWTGSRGAIIGLLVTIGILALIRFIFAHRAWTFLSAGFVFAIVCSALAAGAITAVLSMRSPGQSSLLQSAASSRWELGWLIFRTAGPDAWVLGLGAGGAEKLADSLGLPVIESFYLQLLLEWGVVGFLLYNIFLIGISYHLIRLDIRAMRRGSRGAWLFSGEIILIWVMSPISYGFGVFTGSLALLFATGAAAYVVNAGEGHEVLCEAY